MNAARSMLLIGKKTSLVSQPLLFIASSAEEIMQIVIHVGFDRSGTSFIAGAIERHPQVRYFCQPDNSAALHRAQWEYWEVGGGDEASNRFLRELSAGRIDREYVVSDWFKKYGCGLYELRPDGINLVKTTKVHFKVRWLQQHHNIKVMAVIRDPRATIASLVRNDFHTRWYAMKDFEATRAVVESGKLPETGLDLTPPDPSDWLRGISYLLLVRTAVLCADLGWDENSFVNYEMACQDPSTYLCERMGLPRHDLVTTPKQDFNIIGRSFESEYKGWHDLELAQRDAVESVLRPLCEKLGYPRVV
ncbi:MAG: hypothetical protein ACFCD0_30115 [Gemmataceae bacterium]